MAVLHRLLVDDPRGWDESGVIGSVRYTPQDLAAFADPDVPVLIFVGRFTHQKRLPLLLRAYARARREHGLRAPLLVWGGFPGEWEGQHPVSLVRAEHIPGVFFTGWRGHDELPTGLGCADVFVSPSVGEAFGQVFIEAMACGLPVQRVGTSARPLHLAGRSTPRRRALRPSQHRCTPTPRGDSQLLVHPGAGHLVLWEHPDRVAADSTRFAHGDRD